MDEPFLERIDSQLAGWADPVERLREEERALVPPGEFLPVFEHFRMMPQLDRWIVQHALKWLARGSSIRCLTINVSAQSLADVQFARFVAISKPRRIEAPRPLEAFPLQA